MSIAFIGMVHHCMASEITAPPAVLDRGTVRDFARGAGAGGWATG
jgi:hypothetical protein